MPYLTREGARIWWEATGTGEPVLLIMGLGYPSDMWYRTVPALSGFRAIRFDNRGVGRTGVPPGPYPIPLLADDAAAVLDAAGEASGHVVGISLGGIVAQELALAHPAAVRSLVLIATHPGGAQAVPLEPEVMALLSTRAGLPPREAAEASIPFVYAPDTDPERIREDIDVRMRRPVDPAGYLNQLQGAIDYPGSFGRLATLRAPTLVVHGALDRLVPPANAPLLAGAIPGARLLVIDGASHIVPTDRTAEFNAALVDFLRSSSP